MQRSAPLGFSNPSVTFAFVVEVLALVQCGKALRDGLCDGISI